MSTPSSTADSSAHEQIKRLFNAVCDLPDASSQRDALQAMGADERQQDEVMALLRHAQDDTHFAAPVAAAAAQWLGHELKPGDRLGAWTLQSELGQGGMGRVFLAVRSDGHYEQRAAIKLLLGWSGPDGLARLTRERQILARLSHAHIAQLLDGGTTPAGQPYLVMAYVDGLAIDAHCAAHGLALDARLALFDQVCEAVAHAHRQLTIHCDIKPGNVVVTAEGRAMLLDFGIAQLQGQDGDTAAAMTPGYASPEQRAGQAPGIPSDIYGLGRLLDTLLQPIAASHRRHAELAPIIARATAEAPEGRYDSVGALQRDLLRLLAHQPVSARPATAAYLLSKLLRRRWPWALAASAAGAAGLFLTVQLVQERDRALQEGERARLQAETTREASRFLMSLFTGADPKLTGVPDLPKTILLGAGRERLAKEMGQNAGTRARLLVVLGDVYERTSHEGEAIAAYAEAAKLFGSPELAQPVAEADALRRQALALNNSGQAEAAEAPARRALALREQHEPDNLQDIADAENRLGVVLTSLRRYDEAAQRLARAHQLRQRGLGDDDPNTASALHNLARLNHFRGETALAESQLHQVIAANRRTIGPLDQRILSSLELQGAVQSELQRHADAERSLREAVQGWAKMFGADNGNVAIARQKLARALREAGQLDAAGAELQEALRIETQLSRKPSVGSASIHLDLALWHQVSGRLALAEAEGRTALTQMQTAPNVPALTLAGARLALARTLWLMGRAEAAAPLLAQAQAVRNERLPPNSHERVQTRLLEAELAVARRDGAAAAALIDDIAAQLPPAKRGLQLDLLALRGRHAALGGRSADAARWLQQAWQGQLAWRQLPHPALLPLGLDLLAALQASQDERAAQALRPTLEAIAQSHASESPWRRQLAERRVAASGAAQP